MLILWWSLRTLCSLSQPVVLFFDNDVHGALQGYPRIAMLRDEALKSTPYVGLLSCGDWLSGGSYNAVSRGRCAWRMFAATHYDFWVPGNHEWDYGVEYWRQLQHCFAHQMLCCNFYSVDTNRCMAQPAAMRTYGQLKVGFVGVSTPETVPSTSPRYFADIKGKARYHFASDSLVQVVQRQVDSLRVHGANYVVVLSHLGDDSSSVFSSRRLIASTTGIDVLLDGHSHNVIPSNSLRNAAGQTVLLASTGTQFQYIGRLQLQANQPINIKLLPTQALPMVQGGVSDTLRAIEATYDTLINQVLGRNEVLLPVSDEAGNKLTRCTESGLGNFCADAYRWFASADVALINGGSMRADLPAGELTRATLFQTLPFDGYVCKVQVSGQSLRRALAYALHRWPQPFGGFLQVSGMRYVHGGGHLQMVEVLNPTTGMYVPLQDDALYWVAGTNYVLLLGGDGNAFEPLEQVVRYPITPVEVVSRYITQVLAGWIPQSYATLEGRIRVLP